MTAWIICAVLAVAIYATYRLLHHPGDRHQPRSLAADLPAYTQTVPRADVDGAPPWPVTGAGWAGSHAPDWETACLIDEAQRGILPAPVEPTVEPEPLEFQPSEVLTRARDVMNKPGDVPAYAATILRHGGNREQAVEDAVESCFTKGMSQQVAEMAASNG